MSSEERLRVLEMVAEGKLTAAEADELLAALEPPAPPAARGPFAPLPSRTSAPPQRYLTIRVTDGGEPKVNVRIPLGLARGAAKWLSSITQQVQSAYDLNVKDLVESLGDKPADGTVIDLQDSDTTVWIGVETTGDHSHTLLRVHG